MEDIANSLSRLQLDASVFRSDLGETYSVDHKTGETYIKGSMRKDGTFRRDIRVKAGYIPPDEQTKYVPRFKRDSTAAVPAIIAEKNRPSVPRSPLTKDDDLPWRSTSNRKTTSTQAPKCKEAKEAAFAGRTYKGPADRTKKDSKDRANKNDTAAIDSTKDEETTVSNLVDAKRKLAKAMKNIRRKLKEAHMVKERAEKDSPDKLASKIRRIETLSEKLKNIEAALEALVKTKATEVQQCVT